MDSIFISYRRGSAGGYGGRLHDSLVDRFGQGRVFRDIDSIQPGMDFTQVIHDAVGRSRAVLALIGKDWLTVTNRAGKRRLDDPEDFVRLEIQTALEQGIVVIPVLLDGAPMPDPSELPPPLARLGRFQGIQVSEDRWDYDVGRLVTRLEDLVGPAAPTSPALPGPTEAAPPQPTPPRPPARRPRVVLIAAAVLGLVLAAAIFVVLKPGSSERPGGGAITRQVRVSARGPDGSSGFGMRWTDTGIDVAGQAVEIEATGSVSAGDGVMVPPDGTPGRPDYDPANELKGENHAGLIGKFGATGVPFPVGSDYRTSGQVGRLFLGVNDIDQDNNYGAFDATVTVG